MLAKIILRLTAWLMGVCLLGMIIGISIGTATPTEEVVYAAAGGGKTNINLFDINHKLSVTIGQVAAIIPSAGWHWSPQGDYVIFAGWIESRQHTAFLQATIGRPTQYLNNQRPVVAPDNERVAFTVQRRLYTAPIDAIADAQPVPIDLHAEFPSWSPDGDQMAFFSSDDTNFRRVVILDLRSNTITRTINTADLYDRANTQNYRRTPITLDTLRWSPDGRYLLISGDVQVSDVWPAMLLVDFVTDAERVIQPGRAPSWAADSTRFVYETTDDLGSSGGTISVYDVQNHIIQTIGRGFAPLWSPRSERILFTQGSVWVITDPSGSDTRPLPLGTSAYLNPGPVWRP
jgi:Tol biopolymer transport system component